MDHVWMNIIDSVRELLVLTTAGVVVYKLDHRELTQWIMATAKCDKVEAKEKVTRVRCGHDIVQELENNDTGN